LALGQIMGLMTAGRTKRTDEATLHLRSRMADLSLVLPWVERLASEHGIPESTQYAMNLCLEEALSNIIQHGYAGAEDRPIKVRYRPEDKMSLLIIDDEAPPFNPVAWQRTPVEDTLSGKRVGGLGLRLLTDFASSIKYEPTPTGNRLIMGFATPTGS
jgi:serine/threonine-protein kinase RsbW